MVRWISWQITFLTRGWDIPTITIDKTGLTTSRSNNPAAQVMWGFSTPLLNPSVLCRDGNQVGGDMIFTFGSAVAKTCKIGNSKGERTYGAFQLVFNGETTGPIMAGADESAVQAQLNSLRTIKPSSVIVKRTLTSPQVKGYTWLITFRSSVWADPTIDHSAGFDGNWKGAAAAWMMCGNLVL
ncbi:hypothetical protein GQ600_22644 [Phytophthora cactorum]|nr:hypothetical protein GQ600_22644 [Phytophthora cactorum]